MKRAGFSLLEVVVALTIGSIVCAAAIRLLVQQRLALASQLARAERGAAVRVAGAFFANELGGLDARDGDLIAMDPTRIVYRASRGVAFLCSSPEPGGDVVFHLPAIAWRPVDATVDSVLILAEGDVLTRDDDRWLHADVTGVSAATCDDATFGQRVTLGPVNGGSLGAARFGAPVRFGSVHEVRLYRGGDGGWWLGERRHDKATGWPTIQPVLGPLEPGGLEFRYRDANGQPASSPTDVALIEIAIRPAASVPGVAAGYGSLIRVALRGR